MSDIQPFDFSGNFEGGLTPQILADSFANFGKQLVGAASKEEALGVAEEAVGLVLRVPHDNDLLFDSGLSGRLDLLRRRTEHNRGGQPEALDVLAHAAVVAALRSGDTEPTIPNALICAGVEAGWGTSTRGSVAIKLVDVVNSLVKEAKALQGVGGEEGRIGTVAEDAKRMFEMGAKQAVDPRTGEARYRLFFKTSGVERVWLEREVAKLGREMSDPSPSSALRGSLLRRRRR